MRVGRRRVALIALIGAAGLVASPARAGPPYLTDDPEPVEYRHWEVYLATQDARTSGGTDGTAPHLEVNYGAAPNVQLHLIAPLAYSRPSSGPTEYGPGDVEIGAKLRFVPAGRRVPMIGVFPLLELPAGDETRGLGAGRVHGFVPLWLQKSFGRWLTYGGGGLGLNPGEGNRDFFYAGWLVQRQLSERATTGVEAFYSTADHVGGRSSLRFDVGTVLDLSKKEHLLLSLGHTLAGEGGLQAYLAFQLTL